MGMTEQTAVAPSGTHRQTRWRTGSLSGTRDGERVSEQRWVRPALIALLVVTAGAYTWNLSDSGYANSFYAAGSAGRNGELEGVLLRRARLFQLHQR